jgi:hypothetical protein
MLQEQGTGTWDLRTLMPGPSLGFKFYMLFLLVTWVTASVKIYRVWRAAPPFRLSRQSDSPSYLRQLQISSCSLQHWIGFTFLLWGTFASISLSGTSFRILNDRVITKAAILFGVIDCTMALNMALFTVIFLYVIRWYLAKRIERLQR